MRRIAALLTAPLLTVLVLAGCGSSSSTPSSNPIVKVSGSYGTSPAVTIPAEQAGQSLTVKTLTKGTGPALGKTDSFVGNYAVYIWSGKAHKLAQSTFTTKTPALFGSTLLPGLQDALRGKPMGSRVLAVIPPKDGYGKTGNSQAGITGNDTLVFVVDMIREFQPTAAASGKQVSNGGGSLPTVTAKAGAAPTITIPKSKAPSGLVTKTLIKGTGAPVAKGQTVVVQYVGENWRTGKVFDSSWSRGQPFGFPLGATPSQVIPGWDKGLAGQTVGSRVLLVVPPADGYGKTGNAQAGIKGTDTLVFVVDIVGAVSPT
ncbi:MAG TPA: FKBP-type peptidyl-prolyl cis-trans isomerase [Streptosporangiaceae bacterium]|jgi:peptidylprolyl isomerase|nr:FKBP-type peptidyl-prolyl cis-trans isomerase [Streptosporangiaceae bacterium]